LYQIQVSLAQGNYKTHGGKPAGILSGKSVLTALAASKKIDVTRDFYFHPSINKRKANLGWSQKTRFRKWYFEL